MPKSLSDILDELKGGRQEHRLELTPDGLITEMDPSALDLLGHTQEAIGDLTIFDIVFEGDLEKVLSCLKEGPEKGTVHEVHLLHRSGKRIKVRARPEKVVRGGKVVGVRCGFVVVD